MNLREEAFNIIVKVIKNNMFSDKLLSQSIKNIKKVILASTMKYYLKVFTVVHHFQMLQHLK